MANWTKTEVGVYEHTFRHRHTKPLTYTARADGTRWALYQGRRLVGYYRSLDDAKTQAGVDALSTELGATLLPPFGGLR